MTACPSCGTENPDGARFCNACGAGLQPPAVAGEERKVITCLFCDLVGFTATSESADPEDVNKMLSAYATMARAQIEAYGGVVEKFIGDAVVGIFGVPAAHEDDPERAVRAGLRITEEAEELRSLDGAPLRLRMGINTGQMLVRTGVSPGSGERFLAGDAINTASRLQSVAPEMGVGVGLETYEATAAVFDYEELPPATLKGKAEPVRVFWAKAPRARFGTDLTRTRDSPFIGREIDLALLKGILDKTVAAASPQLVTVVGEPGIGKSRIVAELSDHIESRPEFFRWRQGRCLPYGEGVTFWALGEVVKAHAGILESDAPDVASSRLDAVLPLGTEREWFRQRLLPLLGIGATSVADREEAFTAWRRFLEQIAEDRPTVLVFEDLHWADDAMLAFIEHLADRAERVPLMILATARPELYERRPDYAQGLRNLTLITLAPLSEPETARLVGALLDAAVLPVEVQAPILERSGGNPLYAEEFVRLLKDKHLLVRTGASWALREGAEVPFPGSVHALIAARLDTLPAARKALLADAAVVGKVFWAGALAQMGSLSEEEIAAELRELSRKELCRPARRSTMQGEAEYAFWHVLARDVAYAQIPRASRAAKHVAAARWIESKATERIEDLAEVLAHHYATALELTRAAGDAGRGHELEGPARHFLILAGERALGLDTSAAIASLARALELAPRGHPERARVLLVFGEAALSAGRFREADAAGEEAIGILEQRGDPRAVSRAMILCGAARWRAGDPGWKELMEHALALVEPLPPGLELVAALSEAARANVLLGESEAGAALADRALATAAGLGVKPPAGALGWRGMARADLGRSEGVEDLRQALALAIDQGAGRDASSLYNNLAIYLWVYEGPAAALDVLNEGIRFAESRGLAGFAMMTAATSLEQMADMGSFDQVVRDAQSIADRGVALGAGYDLIQALGVHMRVASQRGDAQAANGSLEWMDSVNPETFSTPEGVIIGMGCAAVAQAALGRPDRAERSLETVASAPHVREAPNYPAYLPGLVRTAIGIRRSDLAASLVAGFEPRNPYAEHALAAAGAALAEARDQPLEAAAAYADAADRWGRFGVVPERGFALLGRGRCLLRLGEAIESIDVLREAREVFTSLGARPALEETDALLVRATALSS